MRPLKAKLMVATLLGLVLSSCASNKIDFARLASEPTPAAWKALSTWKFTVAGRAGNPLGALTLEFTDRPAKTCSSGDWYRADFKDGTLANLAIPGWYTEQKLYPAYGISGRAIVVQLNAPICDNFIELHGELQESSASGTLLSQHMFGGDTLGTFVATPVQ
jgi:hypothetical protein